MRRILGGLIVLILVTGCGGDDVAAERAESARDAALEAGLGDEVADFIASAARGDTATYRVTYPTTDDGTVLTVWNRPPQRRVDTVVASEVTESVIVTDGASHRCRPDQQPRCRRVDALADPLGLFDPAALVALGDALRSSADDFELRVDTATVAGVRATCLHTTRRPGVEDRTVAEAGSMCLSPEGVLLSVTRAGESFTATEYSTEVDPEVFELD